MHSKSNLDAYILNFVRIQKKRATAIGFSREAQQKKSMMAKCLKTAPCQPIFKGGHNHPISESYFNNPILCFQQPNATL